MIAVVVLLVGGSLAVGAGLSMQTAEHHHDAGGDEALFVQTPTRTVDVTIADLAYSPASINAPRNGLLAVRLKNNGKLDHDFTIAKIDVDQAFHRDGPPPAGHEHMDTFAVHAAVAAGQQGELRLHLHAPGTYTFFCTVPGHREAGMTGTLIVE